MTYDESVRYLLALGRELASPQQARVTKFNLENITALTERLGHPERAVPTAHVAGTNGKGSTASMLASILRASGLRTGLYTSPHLLRINERIAILAPGENNAEVASISDADFAATFTRVHAVIEELLATGKLTAHPTYFECVTAVAFEFFARKKVDFAVFEVGLGGRLDSTNVIVPEVAIITQIAFDHENFLGHSIEQIAAEKAGIIKPGAWVVSTVENPAAREVVRRRASEQGARLVEIDLAYRLSDLRVDGPADAPGKTARYRFTVQRQIPSGSAGVPEIEVSLALAGRFQVRNALTAIAAADLLAERKFPVSDAGIIRGLASVQWPGRLQLLQQQPDVYIDGAHNPAGAREVASFWDEHLAGRRIHLVYGAMRDKAVDEVAGLLFPRATTVILTQSAQSRAISADTLAQMTRHLARDVVIVTDPGAALQRAIELAAPEDVVFAAGSLFIVGDLLRYWDARSKSQLPSSLYPGKHR